MKIKLAVAFLILLGIGGSTLAQGIRLDATTVQEMSTTAIPGTTNVLTVPAAPIVKFCSFPANAVPCTNLATTFTSSTLGTPCNTSTQITLVGSTTCVASPDANGNFGFWAQAGNYAYTVTLPGGINLGPYNVTLGIPSGTALPAITAAGLNGQFFVDGVRFSGCPAAVTAAGTTVGTTISLPGTGPIVNCPATVPENIVVLNYDRTRDWGNQSTCTPPFNAINYSYDDGNVYAMLRQEMCTSHQDLNGVSLGFFSLTNLKNATASGNSGGDGIAGEVVTAGALSGTFQAMQGAEHSVDINSTGGTITDARGVIGYVNTEAASTTAIINAVGVKALGCNAINAGNKPTNCYGLEASDQSAVGIKATTRAYSVFSRGRSLFGFSGSSGSGGFDCEDHLNVVHPCLTADGSDNLVLSAISANGILLQDTGANELKIDGNGVRTFKNFKYTETTVPAASAGIDTCYGDSTAHAILCDNNTGGYFQLAQVIKATSAAFATATTAGTCVQNTTAVTGATTAMTANASPVSTPGVGAQWSAFVSSAGNVTINECAVAVSAGGTIAFNIRVTP